MINLVFYLFIYLFLFQSLNNVNKIKTLIFDTPFSVDSILLLFSTLGWNWWWYIHIFSINMEMMMKFTCLWTLLLICHILSKKLECGTAMHVGMLELKMAFCSKISCFWEVRTEGQPHYSTFYRDPEVVGALFHSFLDYHSTIYWEDKIALLVMVASYAYFQLLWITLTWFKA